MTITTMLTNSAKHGMVLQGFFRPERFRAQSTTAVQPKATDFWASKAPRPELMPTKMHRLAVQPKAMSASPPVSAWPGAPRPELLPGMGRSRLHVSLAVAQSRTADGVTTAPVPDGVLHVTGNGKPLDDGIRAKMESFFNADFSGVRVYEGPAAQAMGALAFTLGETLHFAPGLYAPTTRAGVELLGHELTHVVQQREGRVTNPYSRGVAIVQDPRLEAEADETGRQIASQILSDPQGRPRRGATTGDGTCRAVHDLELEAEGIATTVVPSVQLARTLLLSTKNRKGNKSTSPSNKGIASTSRAISGSSKKEATPKVKKPKILKISSGKIPLGVEIVPRLRSQNPNRQPSQRGTAIGMRLLSYKLNEINANLRTTLLSEAYPEGFGEFSAAPSEITERINCLFELKKLTVDLGFYLNLKNISKSLAALKYIAEPESLNDTAPALYKNNIAKYHKLLDNSNKIAGHIGLDGLVNRFCRGIFSDHHGLIVNIHVEKKHSLIVYYHSLDATESYAGALVFGSKGKVSSAPPVPRESVSLVNAIGFERQLTILMSERPDINVIILAEVGLKQAIGLVETELKLGNSEWSFLSCNSDGDSGVNDITMFYKTELSDSYKFSIENIELGNSAMISWDSGDNAKCTVSGMHVLNSSASNAEIASVTLKEGIAAVFGDTNLRTRAESGKAHGIDVIETKLSITDRATLLTSNSANSLMLDKLIVRQHMKKPTDQSNT